MKRSVVSDRAARLAPDFAALHPGYGIENCGMILRIGEPSPGPAPTESAGDSARATQHCRAPLPRPQWRAPGGICLAHHRHDHRSPGKPAFWTPIRGGSRPEDLVEIRVGSTTSRVLHVVGSIFRVLHFVGSIWDNRSALLMRGLSQTSPLWAIGAPSPQPLPHVVHIDRSGAD